MKNESNRSLLTIVGWTAILFFAAIYVVEFLPHHGPPVTVLWLREHFGQAGLIIVNIGVVLAFLALLPYRRPTQNVWKSRGAFFAFVIALMTEMFGWPLVIFVLSPLFDVPSIARPYFNTFGHWPALAGTALSFAGIILIALGWKQIHAADRLVTTGIYRYVRHPQYTGIFLFTFGWIMHWPSVVKLALWPILMLAYVWLAKFEERQVAAEFGSAYETYARETKRFIPGII